jgi:hypothetical protein
MACVATLVRWLSLVIAACSMGKAPPPKPAPPPSGTVSGHVIFEMNGPGRAHGPEESFTRTSGIECTVRSGSAAARTSTDGAYTLRLPVGHHQVSFEDCAKNCCYSPSRTVDVDVKAGSNTVDFVCECDAK